VWGAAGVLDRAVVSYEFQEHANGA
jgi:hypothetical protein